MVYPSNNIRLYCGAVSSAEYFSSTYQNRLSPASSAFSTAIPAIYTRFSPVAGFTAGDTSYREQFSHFPQIGEGCSNLDDCSGNGICDYCSQTCYCDVGFGNPDDFAQPGRDVSASCSTRVCPSGRALGDLPTSSTAAHAIAECSNQGACNRATGVCDCYPPYGGAACNESKLVVLLRYLTIIQPLYNDLSTCVARMYCSDLSNCH